MSWAPIARQLTVSRSSFSPVPLEQALADLGRLGTLVPRLVKSRYGKEVGYTDR